MLVSVTDTLEITDSRETANGFMVFDARLARVGLYTYLAGEVGFTDMAPDAVVSIYRPESAVFDETSMASFAHIPVTDDHPPEMVDASNWSKYAKGYTGDTVKRDGEFVRVPMMLTDGGLIAKFKAGKRELSAGYTADVIRQDGEAPGLGKFHGLMGAPKGNHAAVVKAGRAGSQCRLGDAWPTVAHDAQPGDRTMNTKIVLVDGLQVETTDAGAAAITKLLADIASRDASVAALNTTISSHLETISARDGEIVGLKKAVEDAALTPAVLDAAVAARAVVLDNARKVLGKDFTGAGLTDAAIRKAAVAKQLGDAVVADMDDAAIGGAFKVIEAAKVTAKDSIAAVVLDGVSAPANLADAETRATDARAAMIAGLNGAPAEGNA